MKSASKVFTNTLCQRPWISRPISRCLLWHSVNFDEFVCACLFIRLGGQTLTNQIAPLIVSLIGGLIIIRLAWWEVNIRQLCKRQRNNKDETALVVIPLLMICLERRMTETPGWPQSVFKKKQIGILNTLFKKILDLSGEGWLKKACS